MRKIACLVLVLFSLISEIHAELQIQIPQFNDTYSLGVKQLEEGNFNIDFKDFRFSFIDSEQFLVAVNEQYTVRDSLMQSLFQEMEKENYAEIVNITAQLLSIDYTDITAHNLRRQSFEFLGDTIQAKKYEEISVGLLGSIFASGDGGSCETAFSIIQLLEAYFIVQMLGVEVVFREEMDDSPCDMFIVTKGDESLKLFFNTKKMREGYKKIEQLDN